MAGLLLLRFIGDAQITIVGGSTLIDDTRLSRLSGNTHPLARAQFDIGLAPDKVHLDHMLMVLTPSAARRQALNELLRLQQDKNSQQYHRWLTPQQLGDRFGVERAEIARVRNWLEAHGFGIDRIGNGRTIIEFSGTAEQVRSTFRTEIHQYEIAGTRYLANASDPAVPAALAPVISGIATMHNFRKAPQLVAVRKDVRTASQSTRHTLFNAGDGSRAIAPGDFSTIYNVSPLHANGIDGAGTTIAVVARSNINLQDVIDFRNSFTLPSNPPKVIVNGPDPGNLGGRDEAESILDSSWSGALAPAATVNIVVSASTNSTDGVDLSEFYIVDNSLADVMTESYGACEANYTQAEGAFYLALARQAAAEGITYTVASGDSGAEGCDDPTLETVASGPLSVNVLAATPYNIAIGGTDFNENGGSFWSDNNGTDFASALSYIPEVAWNESCIASACDGANPSILAGGGGASIFNSKPRWQSGVAGIPNDGARDIPDLSFDASSAYPYLICLEGSCSAHAGDVSFAGVSGTSAPTPAFAGIVALIVEANGSRQGQAGETLYGLAASESLASCDSSAPAPTCIFNDISSGNNSVPGEAGYGTSTAHFQAGVGFDLVTGLGSINVYNLVTQWNSFKPVVRRIEVGIDTPSPLNSAFIGRTTFSGWALANTARLSSLTVSIDTLPYGAPVSGLSRPDVCKLYASADCPDVGWNFTLDTSQLPNGPHTFSVTAISSIGQVYTSSATFNVRNWTTDNPMRVTIDRPGPESEPFAGIATFGGWALDDSSPIAQLNLSIDGIQYGTPLYGGLRTDVCSAFPGRAGCPNVGWNYALDTTRLSEGVHTLAVTASSVGGEFLTAASTFTVANAPENRITLDVDRPAGNGAPLRGVVVVGGWAIAQTTSISRVVVQIDGIPIGDAPYGGVRTDVCSVYDDGRPGCPNVGWSILVDTSQLTNGGHILNVIAYAGNGERTVLNRFFGVSNEISNAQAVLFFDTPGGGNPLLSGLATFGGWALDASGALADLSIALDGVTSQTAPTYGLGRPDVCQVFAHNPECPDVGWTYDVDTTKLANGIHTVTLGTAGMAPTRQSELFTVANWTSSNPMRASIHFRTAQSGLHGPVAVGGWVIDQFDSISAVKVAIDGVLFGSAGYGALRADVCGIFVGAAGCPNVGWNFMFDSTLVSDGPHVLSITASTAGGRTSTFTSDFETHNATSNPIRISIDTPDASSVLTGDEAIGGWAIDLNGADIVSVEVLVDSVLNGVATYGGQRTDVCARMPVAGGCPNVGWNYLLETLLFGNGTHSLAIRAFAADGRQYTAEKSFSVAN